MGTTSVAGVPALSIRSSCERRSCFNFEDELGPMRANRAANSCPSENSYTRVSRSRHPYLLSLDRQRHRSTAGESARGRDRLRGSDHGMHATNVDEFANPDSPPNPVKSGHHRTAFSTAAETAPRAIKDGPVQATTDKLADCARSASKNEKCDPDFHLPAIQRRYGARLPRNSRH